MKILACVRSAIQHPFGVCVPRRVRMLFNPPAFLKNDNSRKSSLVGDVKAGSVIPDREF